MKINEIKDDEDEGHHEYPVRKKPEGPEKGNPPQVSHEQRGITDRCEASADIADDKDKENRDVGYKLPFAVSPQERSYQKHGGAGCPEYIGYDSAESKEDSVISGGRLDIPAQEYPLRDNEERGEQDNKGKIFLYFMNQGLEITIMIKEDNHGERENPGDDRLVPIAFPETAMGKR